MHSQTFLIIYLWRWCAIETLCWRRMHTFAFKFLLVKEVCEGHMLNVRDVIVIQAMRAFSSWAMLAQPFLFWKNKKTNIFTKTIEKTIIILLLHSFLSAFSSFSPFLFLSKQFKQEPPSGWVHLFLQRNVSKLYYLLFACYEAVLFGLHVWLILLLLFICFSWCCWRYAINAALCHWVVAILRQHAIFTAKNNIISLCSFWISIYLYVYDGAVWGISWEPYPEGTDIYGFCFRKISTPFLNRGSYPKRVESGDISWSFIDRDCSKNMPKSFTDEDTS